MYQPEDTLGEDCSVSALKKYQSGWRDSNHSVEWAVRGLHWYLGPAEEGS